MADKIYKFQDSKTGRVISFSGPENASEDEINSYLSSIADEPEAPQAPQSPQSPQSPAQSPTAVSGPVGAPEPVSAPTAAPAAAPVAKSSPTPTPAPARLSASPGVAYREMMAEQAAALRESADGVAAQTKANTAMNPNGDAANYVTETHSVGYQQPNKEREEYKKFFAEKTYGYRSAVTQLAAAAKANPKAYPDEAVDALVESIDRRYPERLDALNDDAPAWTSWAGRAIRGARDGKYEVKGIPGVTFGKDPVDSRPESDSGLVVAGKEAILNVPGAAGGLAAAAAANRLPLPTLLKVPAVIGAGLVGGTVSQLGAEKVYDSLDLNADIPGLDFNREQIEANREAHPYAAMAGQVASGLIGGRPSIRNATLPMMGAQAGIGAGIEAGAELYSGEGIDPTRLAIAAAGGALMSEPTRLAQKLGFAAAASDPSLADYSAVKFGEHITYDVPKVRALAIQEIEQNGPDSLFVDGSPVNDTPENRSVAASVKAKLDAGDVAGAATEAGNLTVKKNNGLDVTAATDHINDALQGVRNVPDISIHASPDAGTVPAHLGAKAGTLGVFDKDSGRVHIFADQLTNQSDAKAVIFHEVLGHAGLAWKFKRALNNLLLTMEDKGSDAFKLAVRQWRQDHGDTYAYLETEKLQANPDPVAVRQQAENRRAAEIEEVLADTSSRGAREGKGYDKVANAVKAFARSVGMDHLKFSDREIQTILQTAHENIIKGDKRATDLGGVRYIYAGTGSATANFNSFVEATKLPGETEQQSEARRRMTGWFKGPDDQWRYEISDEGFDFKPGAWEQAQEGSIRAGDAFDHPALFEAYPQLAETKVRVKPDDWDFGRSTQGWYDEASNELVVTPYAQDPLKTAIHELQHAVQEIEGFTKGGNPETATLHIDDDVAMNALPTLYEYVAKTLKPLESKINVFASAMEMPEFNEYRALRDKADAAYQRWEEGEQTPDADALKAAWWDEYKAANKARKELMQGLLGPNYSRADKDALWELIHFVEKDDARRASELDALMAEHQNGIDVQNSLVWADQQGDPELAREAIAQVKGAAYQAYKSIFGEVEARDTALRMEMTPEERAMTKPYSVEGEVLPNEYVYPKKGASGGGTSADAMAPVDRRTAEASALRQAVDEEAEFWGLDRTRLRKALGEHDFRAEVRRNLAEKGLDQDIYDRALPEYLDNLKAEAEKPANVVFASRKKVDPNRRRTDEFYAKHLSPELAEQHRALLKDLEVRPARPDEDVFAEALDLGLDLKSAIARGAFPDYSADIVAMKDLLQYQAEKVSALAAGIRNKTKDSTKDLTELIAAIGDFSEVRNIFDETRGNMGRTFRAFKLKMAEYGEDFEGLSDTLSGYEMANGEHLTDDVIRRMAERIADSNRPALQMAKEADKFMPDWRKYASSYFYNGLLGTTSVQWANLRGNTSALLDSLITDSVSAAVGSIRGAAGAGDRLLWSEVGARWKGVGIALTNPETWRSVVREFTAPVGSAHKNKFQSQAIQNLPASMIVESGTRALQATDAFFRMIAETSNMHGLAVRQANKEAHAMFGGKYGSHTAYVDQRVPEIMAAPSKDLLKEVQRQGDILLLQEDLPKWMKDMSAIRQLPLIGQLTIPILTTTANDMRRSLERTGIPSAFRLAGKNKPTGAELDRNIGRMATGALITAWAAYAAYNEKVDGLGPTDPGERAQWLMTHRPQTIEIGGEHYSTKGLTPFSTTLTVLADTIQNWKRKEKTLSRRELDSYTELTMSMANSFVGATLSNSFMSGLMEISEDPQNIISRLALGAVGPMARYPIVSEVEMKSDPYKRDVGGKDFGDRVWAATKNTDPELWSSGGRQSLPIKIDPMGRPVKQTPEAETDPIVLEVDRLAQSTGIFIVSNRMPVKNDRYIPTDLQNSFRGLEGGAIKAELEKAVADPRYSKMTDLQKARYLQMQVTRIRRVYGKILDFEMIARDPEYKNKMLNNMQEAMLPDAPEN